MYTKFESLSPTVDFLTSTIMMASHYLQILIWLTSWRSSKIRSLSGGFRISSGWKRFPHWRPIIRSHLQIPIFNVFANRLPSVPSINTVHPEPSKTKMVCVYWQQTSLTKRPMSSFGFGKNNIIPL